HEQKIPQDISPSVADHSLRTRHETRHCAADPSATADTRFAGSGPASPAAVRLNRSPRQLHPIPAIHTTPVALSFDSVSPIADAFLGNPTRRTRARRPKGHRHGARHPTNGNAERSPAEVIDLAATFASKFNEAA